jgi:pimeloyl-ACP methyl ester carboxylesterase
MVCRIFISGKGAADKITPPNVADEFNRLLPHAKLIYLPECGHAPMTEKPAAFNSILSQFLLMSYPPL